MVARAPAGAASSRSRRLAANTRTASCSAAFHSRRRRSMPRCTKIEVHLGIDLRLRLWNAAEQEAVRVFAANLRDLLLAAPAGARATMGLDPGFRTGVKVAVVDDTGKVVATHTI